MWALVLDTVLTPNQTYIVDIDKFGASLRNEPEHGLFVYSYVTHVGDERSVAEVIISFQSFQCHVFCVFLSTRLENVHSIVSCIFTDSPRTPDMQ